MAEIFEFDEVAVSLKSSPIPIPGSPAPQARSENFEIPQLLVDHDKSSLSESCGERSIRLGQSYEVGIDGNFSDKNRRRVASDFEHLKILGAGAYGKVLLVRDKVDRRLYAQKQLKKASIIVENRRMEQTMSERSILKAVRHPYIVKLYYALQDQEKVYLILRYAQGGELFTHLAAERMFSEDTTAFYVAQISSALCHLHNIGIVYRDLKPENCLLDADGNLLLTDFGLSKVAEDGGTCKSMLGTPEYMAPEILLGQEYDYAVDWWSLGALMHDLLTGNPPFTGNNHKKIIDKITKQKLQLPYYLSNDAKDLLRRLLQKQPSKRLGFEKIDIIRSHRFFRKIDWQLIDVKSPKLNPPVKPFITDPELAENFSEEFTSQILSPPTNETYHQFKDFTYVGSLEHNWGEE